MTVLSSASTTTREPWKAFDIVSGLLNGPPRPKVVSQMPKVPGLLPLNAIQHAQEVPIVPAGSEATGPDANLACRFVAQQIQRQFADQGQVLRALAEIRPVLILAKRDIADPVDAIPDPPMAPHRFGDSLRVARQAAQIVAGLGRGPAIDPPPIVSAYEGCGRVLRAISDKLVRPGCGVAEEGVLGDFKQSRSFSGA